MQYLNFYGARPLMKKNDLRRCTSSFVKNGYVCLRKIFSNELVDNVVEDIKKKLVEEAAALEGIKVKKNPNIYHYNDSPRVIEAWQWSKNVRAISLNTVVMDFIRDFYEREPIPFSTINFIKATEQPLHSDSLHFGSIPDGYLVGAWVALEDIHKDAGPLIVAEGSHIDPIFTLDKIGLQIPRSLAELKSNNTRYEEYLEARIKKIGYNVVAPNMKKGDVLLWQANLFHGSNKIVDQNLTRLSQVTHYQFEGTTHYNPNYSFPGKEKFAFRDLSKFDIRDPSNYKRG
mgnify:CR=1 FL=1